MSVSPRDIVCNYLARRHAERTRFGQRSIIHVSDLTTRLDFVYFGREFGVTPICAHLARMYQGTLWELALVDEFNRYGYVHEPELHARVKARLRFPDGSTEEREYAMIGHPDWVLNPTRPEHIIELKTTWWTLETARGVVKNQLLNLYDIGALPFEVLQAYGLRREDIVTREGRERAEVKYPLFLNWLLQCAIYRWYGGWRRRIRYTVLVIYRDAVEQFDIPDRVLRTIFEQLFEERLKLTIVALWMAERYGYRQDIPYFLAALDHLSRIGLLGYIANDSVLVTQDYTLPYIKCVTMTVTDEWIFARWARYFGLRHRPPLAGERVPRAELVRRGFRRPRPGAPETVVIRYGEAKALQLEWIMEVFRPWLADVIRDMSQHYGVPEVEILSVEPIGISRSPLQVTPEAFYEKLQRVEQLLRRLEEHETEPGFTH